MADLELGCFVSQVAEQEIFFSMVTKFQGNSFHLSLSIISKTGKLVIKDLSSGSEKGVKRPAFGLVTGKQRNHL